MPSDPLQSIDAVEQYLSTMLISIQNQQNILLTELSPSVNPNDISSILAVLPSDIKAFIIFRDDLSVGSPSPVIAVIDQFNEQLADNYNAEMVVNVGEQVVDLLNETGVTQQQLEDYLDSL